MEIQLNKISLWLFSIKQAKEEKKEKKAGSCRIKGDATKKNKEKTKKERKNGAIKNQIDLLQASCIVIHFLIFKKGLRKKETR